MYRVILLFCFAFIFSQAGAHRLNEYLQATTISVDGDSIRLHMRLTPGTDIAPKILQLIDTDHDGIVSDHEQRSYAALVMRSLWMRINDREAALMIDDLSFSPVPALMNGTGEIQLYLSAAIPNDTTHYNIVFENRHQRQVAVYLVNCLLPQDRNIHIIEQSRNYDQSIYLLTFTRSSSGVTIKQDSGNADEKWAVINTYFFHGIRHILFGFDHLLFLGALVLAAASLWDLVKIITAFTIAHSITLTLAVFHLVHLPIALTEIIISLSIVVVALQNIYWRRYAGGNSRIIIAFVFGLFHGLGFAGGLLELMHHMNTNTVWRAIAGFTIGIEIGNQLIMLPLFAAIRIAKAGISNVQKRTLFSNRIRSIGSAFIAMAGVYYVLSAIFF